VARRRRKTSGLADRDLLCLTSRRWNMNPCGDLSGVSNPTTECKAPASAGALQPSSAR